MKNKSLNIPEIIIESKNQKWLNVFILNSSIQLIVARLIVLKYNIDSNNILLVPQRNTDISVFKNFKSIFIQKKKFDNYIDKLFFHNGIGGRIYEVVKKASSKFLLYTPMASKEANFLISKKNCCGHIYLENGQHSWMNQLPYTYSNINFFKKYKLNWGNSMKDGYRYRNDSAAYIGIHKKSFPDISREKKFIINEIHLLKKYYKKKLNGNQTIGLTCASRRLTNGDLKSMLNRLFSNIPEGSIVKPHPSYTSDEMTYKKFKEVFFAVGRNKYKLCPRNVILELEMLYKNIKLVGPQSSLSEYAILFGSSFKQIKLY